MPIMTEERGATEILKKQHRRIQDLFSQFDGAAGHRQKKSIGDAALREIESHARLAEEVFYPAARRFGGRRHVAFAQAAHDVPKLLVREIKALPAGASYNDRFDLLKGSVRQQIDHHESELLPRVEKSKMDLEKVGGEMAELMKGIARGDRNAFARKSGVVALGLAAVAAAAWLVSVKNSSTTKKRR